MQTKVLPATPASLAEAASLLQSGQVVGFPTETVYGLGANALDADAVRRIFEAKGRPADNPLIVHISALDQLAPLIEGELPENARKLAAACWPGPLTMLLPRSAAVPDVVTAGLPTVGIRMPSHPVARALIDAAQRPIAAPSANRSGRPSPTTAAHVFEDMDGRVPLILDGGSCQVGVESTVLDVTSAVPRILRPGGVTAEQVAEICGAVEVDGAVMRPLAEGEKPRSPGMKYRHYAPKGALTIVRGEAGAVAARIAALYDEAAAAGETALILALDGHIPLYGARRTLSLGRDEAEMAARLFAALREADELGAKVLFSEAVSTDGVGLAVMNRLGRAAAFHVIEV